MSLRHTARTAAAALLAAAAVVLLPQDAAQAAPCSGASGVTVVVDYNELNGGALTSGCAADGGGKMAAAIFPDAGYPLEYVSDSGFVCRVSGFPADANCGRTAPANAYWSLWVSNGEDGKWSFASRGVSSLKVPEGGYVAFAWHQGSGNAAPPDVAATPRVVRAGPTPTSGQSGSGTSGKGGKGGTKKTATPKPSASPSASATSASPTATPSVSESATTETPTEATTGPAPTEAASPTEASSDVPAIDEITEGPEATSADTRGDDEGGFPAWLGIGLVVVVLGAAAAVPILRRR